MLVSVSRICEVVYMFYSTSKGQSILHTSFPKVSHHFQATGTAALFYACDYGHTSIVKHLLDAGASAAAKNTVSYYASLNDKDLDVSILLPSILSNTCWRTLVLCFTVFSRILFSSCFCLDLFQDRRHSAHCLFDRTPLRNCKAPPWGRRWH